MLVSRGSASHSAAAAAELGVRRLSHCMVRSVNTHGEDAWAGDRSVAGGCFGHPRKRSRAEGDKCINRSRVPARVRASQRIEGTVLPQSESEFAFVRVSGNTLAEEHP